MDKSAAPRASTLDAGSRLWALLATGLCLLALLIQLPAGVAAGIGALAVATTALSWRRALPGPLRLLLALLIIGAVLAVMGMRFGRDTGCALLAAMLALKPAETVSLRDARSLLGFALFAPFSAFLLDQGPLTLLLAALGVAAGLLALSQLADAEADAPMPRVSLRQRLWRVGRLLLIGLPLMLATFWFFPRFPSPLWGVPERALAQPGLSDRMSPGGWLDLMADDNPALRVQFFGAVPKPEEMYWRGLVLWDYDGREWTRSPWIATLPAAPAESAQAPRWDYEMMVEPTEQRWLVALDLPVSTPADAQLDRDRALVATQPMNGVTRWRVASAPPSRFDTRLPTPLRERALALPAGLNPRTHALAARWRREAGGDDLAIVRRALEWIRRDFGYTLDTPLPGRDAVDEFLFDQQRGYCEHFSSSFTTLMRASGIPARVVVGYAGGYRNRFGDYWIVRKMDAHAWSEVWLPQRGWVRVDPTAAVAPERIFDTLEDRLGADTGAVFQRNPLFDAGDWLRRGWNDLVLGFDARRQQHMLRALGLPPLDGGRLGALFALAALLAVGAMAWLLARGERERDPLLRAWHALGARYARIGLGRQPHEPALDWARRVAASHPAAGAVLVPLSQRFAEARYAAAVSDIPALVRDLRRHRP
ncbi:MULTISPECIES: DUF3488 and transglutaminase-like domain-containing protein [Pseudoxanthomonas]|uniref:transglutaminase TgpA family protein n=1 Tax=Pseudoxanthomonas TaxID=83618 RepID=UPI001618CA7E|nr:MULTISPECIES: DUF3488 and transglutaminase-like domain-containing protein [Pseudoxanthomonas]MBB3274863.1 transglutaminase-like putative cysteine protease [Pseudoxanthomonas sp. OG2]MBV7475245.1 DUF3488 and transglutaminase-like domain-containing protein [Pseudoxanthomonas sp. PXM05]